MLKVSVGIDQPFLVPGSVARRTEEFFPHVIVHTVNLPAGPREKRDHFAADKTARPSNKQLAHANLIERARAFVKREQSRESNLVP